jgi:cell division protein ZapA (FtsZ GTPase activity inhibitor)
MSNVLLSQISDLLFMPIVRRLASNVATAVSVIGVSQGQAETLEAGIIIALGVAADLALSKSNRTKVLRTWGRS